MALVFEIFLLYGTLGVLIIFMLTPISKVDGFSMKMISRDSIDSPLFPRNLSLTERHHRLANLSLSYAHSLHLRSIATNEINSTSANITGLDPNVVRPGVVSVYNSLFVVELAIGMLPNPYFTQLLLDTGSDDVWVQCMGCHDCFEIKGGPLDSKTTYYLPCEDPLCIPKTCGPGGTGPQYCTFGIYYITGYAGGVVSTDTFSFRSDTGNMESIPNFVFGCAYRTAPVMFGTNAGPENPISGIFGIGTGPRSILMQQRGITKQRFTYCLSGWEEGKGMLSFLRFADDAQIRSYNPSVKVQTIPFKSRYFVELLDLSIDGIPLTIDPELFRLKEDGTGGFTIDSGSAQSRLVPAAYNHLRMAMVLYLAGFNVVPIIKKDRIFDPCYQLPLTLPRYPSITFHFRGAGHVVDFDDIFKTFDGGNIICMTIVPGGEGEPNILGAIQQANTRFLFDIPSSTISFIPELCKYDH